MKKNVYFIFLVIAAIVLGHFLGAAVVGTEGLGWLSYGKAVGFSPTRFTFGDLFVFDIGFTITFNIAQLLFLVTAFIVYCKTANKIPS